MFRLNVPSASVRGAVVMVKLALVWPAGTLTLVGWLATVAGNGSSNVTTVTLLCAALNVTVPVEVLPPITLLGLTDTPASTGAGPGASTVRTVLNVRRPSVAVIVTLVFAAGGCVAMVTCCPSTVLGGMTILAGAGTMEGWLLVNVMVGPPPEEMPLTSSCPIELCPPVIGLEPVILKSPSVGIGKAGAGFGGTRASQAWPPRSSVLEATVLTTSMKVTAGTIDVATVKPTLLVPDGIVMPPSCGNTLAFTLMPLMAPGCPWLLIAPGKPWVSVVTGATVCRVAGTRSPPITRLLLMATGFGPVAAQKSLALKLLDVPDWQAMLHSCWNVQTPNEPSLGKEQL